MTAPSGERIADARLTLLQHGGAVVTWLDTFSHTLQANYAVFDREGHLLAQAETGNGYSTDFEAVALPGGGFLLADAESDLFGEHSALVVDTFNANGHRTGPAHAVINQTSDAGRLWMTELEGDYYRGRVHLTWQENGESMGISIKPHGHVDSHDAPHTAMIGPVEPPAFAHDAWFV